MAASEKPRLACELTPERVIAGRAADSGSALEMLSARTLPSGSMNPGLATGNVVQGEAVSRAIADAIAAVGTRSRDLIAIVPDAAVRLALLDFEELPEKPEEAESVVRFRLKKSLPFDVTQAALSYEVRRANGSLKVLAAVMPGAVLQEYEAVFRQAGYSPGVVLPSMLAALGSVEELEPALVVKVDPGTTSVAIVRDQALLLHRTLENARGGSVDAAALAEDIYPSLVFFQDTYGMKVERILLAGLISARELGPALEAQTAARVSDLVSEAQFGAQAGLAPSLLAPVVGALIA